MIRPFTLVRMGWTTESACPGQWQPDRGFTVRCAVSGEAHFCVGDVGHGGKHVCPCGALRSVYVR